MEVIFLTHIAIGPTIARLRRERGVTQEQLAAAVGVSAPAVSKWETGQSYPDITLLPPLARFFGVTVDALLAYLPDMTEAARDAACEAIRETFGRDGWTAGLSACDTLLQEYPSDMPLRIRLCGLLMESLVLAGDDAQRAEGRARQIRWLEEAANAEDLSVQHIAKGLLGGLYLGARRLEEGEALLAELNDSPFSASAQYMPTLRLLQGRYDDGMKLAQQNLLMRLNDAQMALLSMTSLALKLDDIPLATTYADAMRGLLDLFGLESSPLAHPAAQAAMNLACAAGDHAGLLDATEAYVHALQSDACYSGLPFFNRHPPVQAAKPTPQNDALRRMLADDLEANSYYDGIRDEPRFQRLLASLRKGHE